MRSTVSKLAYDSARDIAPKSIPPKSEPGAKAAVVRPLDGYQIVGELGAGGMGTVWRAKQVLTGREVALKILNGSPSTSESTRMRFLREVEVASLLEHPNIARVYDSGIQQDACYYTMELIEGVTLGERMRLGTFDELRSLSLMSITCRAVQYAHQKGVIHRDLKPSNILVDKNDVPHVVDFGLGKFLDEEVSTLAVTVEGEWAGTPSYMSPEQAAGNVDQVDTRSDVYSLGVILYEMVTGRLPHAADGGQLAVLHRVIHDEIVRPRKINARIDADVEALILKATAKNPEDRYRSAGEIADDIERFLKDDPIAARRPTVAYLLQKKVAKHWVAIAGVLAVAIALIALAAYSSVRISHERDLAVAAAVSETSLRHGSERTLADSLILDADGMSREGHWYDAVEKYRNASQIQTAENVSTTNAELGLLDASRHAPEPIAQVLANADGILPPVAAFFDSDGRTIRTETPDGLVQIYDAVLRQVIRSVGHRITDGQVNAVFESSDPNALLGLVTRHHKVGSATSTIEETNVRDGSVTKKLKFPGVFGSHVAVSPDGEIVVGAGQRDDSPAYRRQEDLWLVDARKDGEPVFLAPNAVALRAICLSPDLRTCVTGDTAGSIRFWDVSTRSEIHYAVSSDETSDEIPAQAISCLTYASDGKGILVGDAIGDVSLLSLTPVPRLRRFGISPGLIRAFAFSRDGQFALSGDQKGNVILWTVRDGRIVRQFSAGDQIVSLGFSQDGRSVLASTPNGTIYVWPVDVADQAVLYHCPTPVTAVAASTDGLLAAITTGHDVQIVDTATGRLLWTFTLPGNVAAVGFSPDGSDLDVATTIGDISRFELFGSWRQIEHWPAAATFGIRAPGSSPNASVHFLIPCVAPNVNRAMFITRNDVTVVNVVTGKKVQVFPGRFVLLGCISPDGKKAVAVDARPPRTMEVFDVEQGTRSEIKLERLPFVKVIAMSPDAATIFLAYDDGAIRAMDVATGKQKWAQLGVQQMVKSLVVSPDGSTILSGGGDGTLRLWSAVDGLELRRLGAHLNSVSAIAFSGSGELILSNGGSDNVTFSWDLSVAPRIRTLEAAALGTNGMIELDRLQGRPDWGSNLLDQLNDDAAIGLEAARCRWQNNESAKAAADFASLARQQNAGGYVQACQAAAGQGR